MKTCRQPFNPYVNKKVFPDRRRGRYRILGPLAALMSLALICATAQAKDSLRRTPVVIAVEKVSPAVVNISTVMRERVGPLFPFPRDEFFRDFFPDLFSREYTRSSLGSGVIIDGTKGYIITNHHVVAGAAEIKVLTAERKEYSATILGSDPRSDLAVLQIKIDGKIPEIMMGNSEDLMIGETVIAIGNPFGLSHTVTTGVISALDRSVRTDEGVYRNFIQTDASINPGNSGGPLLNIEGDLIGINTAIYQKAQGIGFAIPISKARRIVRELLDSGEVRLPWIGLEIQELTPELKASFRIQDEIKGVLVSDVIPESPAEAAGLKRGDIIHELGGVPLDSPEDYRGALGEFTTSDRLRLKVIRKGRALSLSVQPVPFPPGYALELVYRRVGMRIAELGKEARRQYGLPKGLFISEVRRNSTADQSGLEPGDLLMKINDREVNDLGTLKEAVSRYHHLPSLTWIVRRGPYAYSLTLPF